MGMTCPQNWSSLKVSLRGFLDIGKFLLTCPPRTTPATEGEFQWG